MMTFSFSEKHIVERLQALPSVNSKMFAALCAWRLIPGFSIYQTKTFIEETFDLKRLLDIACRHIGEAQLAESEIVKNVSVLDAVIKDIESTDWRLEQAAAEDAAAAVYYTYRCLQKGDPRDAAWSAARAYSAVDNYVCDIENININDAALVMMHPIIQQELARQERDLSDLTQGHRNFEELMDRAKNESVDFLPWYNSSIS